MLRHKVFKPSYACISSVRSYFTSLAAPVRDDELIVVGDRLFTDVVIANRMARRRPLTQTAVPEKLSSLHEPVPGSRDGPLSIWTSGVWQRESMGVRWLEKRFMQGIQRYVVETNGVAVRGGDGSRFLKPEPKVELSSSPERVSMIRRVWNRLRRA